MAETTTRIKSDVSSSCLVCLRTEIKHVKSLLKTYTNGERYSDIYEFCTGINIEDKLLGYPPWICEFCEEKLLDFYHFKSNCLNSDEVITHFLNNRPEMVEPDQDDESMDDSDNTDDENNELDKKPIICDFCTEVLPTTTREYNQHIAAHYPGNSKPFQCKTCNAKFVSTNSLKVHEKSHKKEQDRYKSEYCNTWFPKTSAMFRHNNKYHKDERIFKCKISKEPFITHQKLLLHFEKYHNPAEPNVCMSPYKNFPKRLKNCPNTTNHNCEICNRKFPTRTNLKLHIRSFHPAPEISTEIPEAPRLLPCVDESSEAYLCEFCGKCFTEINSYDVHKMFHPEQLEVGETLSKNAVTGKFNCSKCDLNIYQLALYEAHMDKFHKNDYTCDVCKKFFFEREQLPEHRRTHFKLDNHVCTICDKRFLCSIHLNKHLKAYHPGPSNVKKGGVIIRRQTFVKIFTRNL